jgi:polyhydroxyalkanoate synthesis regulator phasin
MIPTKLFIYLFIFVIFIMTFYFNSFAEEPLFKVSDDSDNIIFAVYSDGIKVYTATGDSLMSILSDSIRFYTASGARAGARNFAISSTGAARQGSNNIVVFSPESNITEVVDRPTMLWYPEKNAFLVGHVWIESPDSVGTNSIAVGDSCKAIGSNSQAWGRKSRAFGTAAMALGDGTEATGDRSLAMGRWTKATNANSVAMGCLTEATGLRTTAMGFGSKATDNNAVAMGYYCEARGKRSLALGSSSIASGDDAIAMGVNTIAFGNNSLATGEETLAKGQNSVAMGYYSQARGAQSLAQGNHAIVCGNNSVALGYHSVAKSLRSVAIGSCNLIEGDSLNLIPTDPLFVVGNGVDENNRSNALTLYKNGDLEIAGSFSPMVTTSKNLGTNSVRWDTLYCVNVNQSSDRRLKENINQLDYGLESVLQLKPVSYTWKERPEKGEQIGLVAQDVKEIIEEVVSHGETMGIQYTGLIPVLIKAIQDQQKIIEQQEDKTEVLKSENTILKSRLDELESRIKQIEAHN